MADSNAPQDPATADQVIDLSKPTGCFDVAVFHYAHAGYAVDTDRGFGRVTIYETQSRDKAVGVAEYLESTGRIGSGEDGEPVENIGEPFDGGIYHWDCGCGSSGGHAATLADEDNSDQLTRIVAVLDDGDWLGQVLAILSEPGEGENSDLKNALVTVNRIAHERPAGEET